MTEISILPIMYFFKSMFTRILNVLAFYHFYNSNVFLILLKDNNDNNTYIYLKASTNVKQLRVIDNMLDTLLMFSEFSIQTNAEDLTSFAFRHMLQFMDFHISVKQTNFFICFLKELLPHLVDI